VIRENKHNKFKQALLFSSFPPQSIAAASVAETVFLTVQTTSSTLRISENRF